MKVDNSVGGGDWGRAGFGHGPVGLGVVRRLKRYCPLLLSFGTKIIKSKFFNAVAATASQLNITIHKTELHWLAGDMHSAALSIFFLGGGVGGGVGGRVE